MLVGDSAIRYRHANMSLMEGIKDHDWARKIMVAEFSDCRSQTNMEKGRDIVMAKRITKESNLSTNYSAEKFHNKPKFVR